MLTGVMLATGFQPWIEDKGIYSISCTDNLKTVINPSLEPLNHALVSFRICPSPPKLFHASYLGSKYRRTAHQTITFCDRVYILLL